MKSWFKNFSIVPFFLMLLACNGTATQPVVEVAEQTANQTVEVAIPSPSPEAKLDLQYLQQRFVQHAVLLNPNWSQMAKQEKAQVMHHIVASWRKTMGEVNPDTMEYNIENVNQFLQFVRLSHGAAFAHLVNQFAARNEATHDLLRITLQDHDVGLLNEFLNQLVEQTQPALKLRSHILAVAQIYGVKFEDTPATDEVLATLVSPVIDRLSSFPWDVTIAINVRLSELYKATSLGLQGGGHFSYLPLTLLPDNFQPADGVQRLQVGHTLYGAVKLKNDFYLLQDAQ